MPTHSGSKRPPRKREAVTAQGGISAGLRKDIAEAAKRIRAAHTAELANAVSADRAGRLFGSLLHAGTPPATLLGANAGVLAEEVGGLVSDAIRAGTGLLEGSLSLLAQTWMAPLTPPAVQRVAGKPPLTPDEATLLGVLRQFMPMLLTALNDGGDGYGLARTVIALFGQATYDQAAGLGSSKIMELVRREPDLWVQVEPVEARFRKFLDEFTGYSAAARQAGGALGA